ncbi:SRPBCC family protein [Desulfonatronovibrio magnus]|uniref:SRPBCC family protein n=1 Tax=Desulfonatronovibrio magnus TaxID=698827 RepID=UPI0005EBC992|nr:SRPBCC family protein [Desulfonatronovibrio magnus]
MNRLRYEQTLPISLDQAWNFFSMPENLCRITPDWMCFDIKHKDAEHMYPGMIIEYSIKAVAGIPMSWITEITHVEKPYFFVDEQRQGPYRFWHHQHHFRQTDAGVEVTDTVHYSLYFGMLAEPVRRLLVLPKLKEIFSFRRDALERIFSSRSY